MSGENDIYQLLSETISFEQDVDNQMNSIKESDFLSDSDQSQEPKKEGLNRFWDNKS